MSFRYALRTTPHFWLMRLFSMVCSMLSMVRLEVTAEIIIVVACIMLITLAICDMRINRQNRRFKIEIPEHFGLRLRN